MTITIREITPEDPSALHAWWEVGAAASAERPFPAWASWEVSQVTWSQARTDIDQVFLLAEVDGHAVGAGRLVCFLTDNTHLTDLEVYVAPAERRRGIGTALLTELEERAASAGRSTYFMSVPTPVHSDGAGVPFAAAHGYPVASREETKLVDLDDTAGWAALDAEVAARLGDYRLEVFEDVTPDHWVDGVCTMLGAFIGEVPAGDLDLEAANWTPDRLREHEARTRDTDRAWVVGVAVAPDGSLCGFTEVGVSRQDPRLGRIGGTLVLPGHRGHALGLGMKLATHRRVRELFPSCESIETTNADVNAWMNAINVRMGYRIVERLLDVQKMVRAS